MEDIRAQDHPRVCGEKLLHSLPSVLNRGSPPRMRGKVPTGLQSAFGSRITPAYAGKSCSAEQQQPPVQDHPRVCGEKSMHKARRRTRKGSPPRMRGKAQWAPITLLDVRITPAYAGKSQQLDQRRNREQDHPRVCGEKGSFRLSGSLGRGSPPRMRGKDL